MKIFTTRFNKLCFTLLALLIGVSSAWGKTLTAKVGVGSGKGTAQVEIYSKWFPVSPVKSTSSTGAQASVSYNDVSIVNWGYSKYIATPNDGYIFEAWYTNSGCTSGKKSDNPYTTGNTTGNRTDEYWAKFIPVTVNSVNPSSTSVTFSKPESKDVTLTFSVSHADAKADFNTPVISNTTDWTLKSWNYSNNSITVVVTMTVTNATDKTANHNTTVTLSSKGTSDNQSKQATISVTVDMNPQFTCNIKNTYLVDDDAINLASLWTSTSNGAISYSLEQFTPSGTNNEGATAPYIGTDNKLHFGQAGTVSLKLTQAASVSFNSGSTTKTITINKRDNSIVVAGIDDSDHEIPQIKTDWYDNEITLTADNKDYTNRPIHNERTQGTDDQASFGQQEGTTDKWVVYTGQNVGVVTWRVWQEENYKYKAAENTFSIEVIAPPCGCILKQQTWSSAFQKPVGDIGLWDFGGEAGEALSFELRSNGAAGNHMTYTLVTDGQDEDPVKLKAKSELYFSSVGTITLGEGEHNTTAVKFAKSSITPGLNTDNPYVHNIVVTRKRWFKVQNAESTEITSLPDMIRTVGDDALTATFNVDFSTCDSEVKVASNHDNVTFANNDSRYTISTNPAEDKSKGYKDQKTVTLTYTSDTIEDKIVTITIYTQYENKTLTLHVKTIGKEAKIVYVGNASYPVNNANIPASQLFEVRDKNTNAVIPGATVTLSGSSEAASVVSNALDPQCGGSITLTASFAGDSHYKAAENVSQAVSITKLNDEVTITNTHTRINIGAEIDLAGLANALSNTNITFTSSNTSIFKIANGKIIALASGTANLIATSEGDCTYISANNSQEITVTPSEYVFTGEGSWDTGKWLNDEKPAVKGDVDIRVTGKLTINQETEVKSLTIEGTGSVTTVENGKLIVNGNSKAADNYGDLHVKNGGEIVLNGQLNVRNFILDAKLGNTTEHAASGQVHNCAQLDVNGETYFQMAFDPDGKISFGWYDFVVPFEVEAVGGIFREGNLTTPLKSGVDYLVQEYNENKRASNTKAWTNFSGTMQPGRVYTITFNYNPNFDQNVFVFKKKAGSTIGGSTKFNAVYTAGTKGETKDSGWNGLGNGTLRHAQLIGVDDETKVQIYDHASNSYVGKKANNFTFAVGTSFFMQVGSPQEITLAAAEASINKPLLAPSRQVQSVSEFTLTLTAEDSEYAADYLWVSANEEATGEYTIGRDLLKMGTPTEAKVAQMWTIRNNMVLCDNEMTLINDNAQCELGFFTPKAGEYILAIEEKPEEASLYLTYNNQVIWDLTEGAYVLELEKGTTEGYGLSLQAKRAPQITTGVETVENQQSDIRTNRKVIIDNTLYIVTPEGKIFNVIGKKVQ